MCYSKAEGGARCSTHAREALDKAVKAYGNHLGEHRGGDAADLPAIREESARLRSVVVARQFDYATTPEGAAQAHADIAAQEEQVAAIRAGCPASGAPGSTAWLDSDEYKTLSRMKSSQAAADKVREAQDAARVRHQKVQRGEVGALTAQALAEEQGKPAENRSVQDYNGSWHTSQVIGVVAVDEPFTRVDASGEVAAWSTTHEVKPGIYPVHLTDRGNLTWRYDTTITDEHFPPLYGGVAIGPGSKDHVGQAGRLSSQSYAFAAPSAYTPGTEFGGGSLVLRKGVSVGYEVTGHDGRTNALTRFTVNDPVDTEPRRNERFIVEDRRREEHRQAAAKAAAHGTAS